jgi:GNAT superfamily N-acetyltransferase
MRGMQLKSMAHPDLLESNGSFIKAWSYWSQRSPAGTVFRSEGVAASWMNRHWPICNLSFLTDPVANEADLTARIKTALEHAHASRLGWIFFVSADFLPAELRPQMASIFSRYSLAPQFALTGMACDALLPPRRVPPVLDLRPVSDSATRCAAGEINSQGYHVPAEWGIEALNVAALWETPAAFGFVGFLGDLPVCCAKTIVLEDHLYVGLVATRPDYRGRGYAETVMRHSIAHARRASGLRRILLHASESAQPLYQAMGFYPVTQFQGFMPSDQV